MSLLLVIMGRGIQMHEEGLDPSDVRSWGPTEDFEVCDTNSAHLPVSVPENDSSPYSFIGGGKMNLLAGIILARRLSPDLVVCAYGDRSDYLKSVNGPTESEVMSSMLEDELPDLNIEIWPRERSLPGLSNTGREVQNTFEFVLEAGIKRVVFVTVGVHVPRTSFYVSRACQDPRVLALGPVVLESEEILLDANYNRYSPRVEKVRKSESFGRSWKREAEGVSKIIRNAYGDRKPPIVAS